jgi:putative colanic acid biosynthesis acetyltransferase WcaF
MQKTDLSKFNNTWYKTGASAFKRLCWYKTNALFFKSSFPFNGFKIFMLKIFGAQVGKSVVIKPGVNIKYPWLLAIGNHVWIGENVWIDNLAQVTIADNVCISQGAMLLTGNHNYKKTSFDLITGVILLEQGAWIGAGAMVCPGVKCKQHSVLSVMSVATKDLEAYTVYQGNPAVKIRDRKIEL